MPKMSQIREEVRAPEGHRHAYPNSFIYKEDKHRKNWKSAENSKNQPLKSWKSAEDRQTDSTRTDTGTYDVYILY